MDELPARPAFDGLEKRKLLAELQGRMFGATSEVLLGRYILGERLGSGAMGVVYVARDPRLGRDVALKVLHPDRLGDSAMGHRRLREEARALSRVSHPNVIEVYDVGQSDGRVYVAMELVVGVSLERWLASESRAWLAIVRAFAQAGAGLSAAHGAGVVHRDFKPSNVLVGADGRIRVVDFGLAKAVRYPRSTDAELPDQPGADELEVTAEGALVGTPRYMAPAQLEGAEADALSDQYAFCVALFEALFRESPFDIDRMLASKRSGERALPPSGSGAPRRVRKALRKGLNAVPEDRHHCMQALLDAMAGGEQHRARTVALLGVAAVGVGLVAASSGQPSSGDVDKRSDLSDVVVVAETVAEAELRPRIDAIKGLVGERHFAEAEEESSSAILRARALGDRKIASELGNLRGVALQEIDRLPEARAALEVAHLDAASAGADLLRVRAALALAGIEFQSDHGGEAGERWYRDAEAVLAGIAGETKLHVRLAQLRVVRARARGDGQGAITAGRESVAAARRVNGNNHESVVTALQALGLVLFEQQQFDEARGVLEEAVDRGREGVGADSSVVLNCISILAAVDSVQSQVVGDPKMAARAVASARRAAEAFEAALGADHYDAVNARLLLGITLTDAGDQPEALAELVYARDGFERLRGPHDPGIAVASEAIGILYLDLGEYAAAEVNLQRAAILTESSLGNDHPALITVLGKLGAAQLELGRPERARVTIERCLELSQTAGRGQAVALELLGRVEEATGDRRRAKALYEEAADGWSADVGEESIYTQRARGRAAAITDE